MTMTLKLKDFAYSPGPRYIRQGAKSGELYRTTILTPAIRKALEAGEKVIVDLDGTAGIGRSFLEEISGGLIREDKIPYSVILSNVEFLADELPVYKSRISKHLKDAHEKEHI